MTVVPHTIAYILAIGILAYIAERVVPLRAVSPATWQWTYRPARTFPPLNKSAWIQILVFAVVGLGVGGVFRLAIGVARPKTLPEYLNNGVTQNIMGGTSLLFNSELTSSVYAVTWLKKSLWTWPAISHISTPSILIRRLLRRGYIPLSVVCLVLLGYALEPFHSGYVAAGSIAGWGVVGSAVFRGTKLDLGDSAGWRAAFVTVLVFVGTIVQLLLFMPSDLLAFALCSIVAMAYISVVRGRPQEVNNFYVIDTGVMSFSPEMMKYWLAGGFGLIPAGAAGFVFM